MCLEALNEIQRLKEEILEIHVPIYLDEETVRRVRSLVIETIDLRLKKLRSERR